ncbi:MAG: RNA-binding S4 domain-containing protein [Alphaproteobacteria bacterium]|nr:RNA-binding S4 domain-containing protein [Alphaproteobacteria bacterium]
MMRQRVDVWLHRARIFKTRTMAESAVEEGAVRLQRAGAVKRVEKAAEPVGPGDALLVAAPRGLRTIRILALGARRGPPAEARQLYAEDDQPA